MPYSYLDHESDVGIRGIGATPEEAFEEGTKAMLNFMWEISAIEEKESIAIECEAFDLTELFVETLNEILYKKDVLGFAFSRFKVKEIKSEDGKYRLIGTILGEPFDLDKHPVKTEVKAATYSGLKFEQTDGQYMVQCILDV